MKVFWNPTQLAHAPAFFLVRGQVRRNFEVPARAEALLAACQAMRLTIAPPPPVDFGALLAVHDPDYLGFLRDGHDAWSAIPDTGPEMVANHHPTPDMMACGARPPTGIVGQVGWYTADAACPFGPQTW